MRSLWWLALAVVACGDVQKVPDAAIPDAYVPDSPNPPVMCAAGEMTCNGSCANPMTSELYCGNCNTQCSPTQGCLNGLCVPANTSCLRVRDLQPEATDGVFRNPNTGAWFYCDFTARKQWEFALGQYNVGYTGYSLMSSGSFTAEVQAAFIKYYNALGGLQTIAPFTSGLCCVTQANNNELYFGGSFLSLFFAGANACNINYNGIYQFGKGQGTTNIAVPPIPDTYFTTNPVGEGATCGDSNNIGFFFRTTTF